MQQLSHADLILDGAGIRNKQKMVFFHTALSTRHLRIESTADADWYARLTGKKHIPCTH